MEKIGRGRKKGQKIEKREERNRKIISALANMEQSEKISCTKLARLMGIHPDTLRDLIDLRDSMNQIGFETIRDNVGRLKLIIRTNENLDIKKEIREIKKDVLDIKTTLDEIKEAMKKR